MAMSGFESEEMGAKCNTIICSGRSPSDSNVRPVDATKLNFKRISVG